MNSYELLIELFISCDLTPNNQTDLSPKRHLVISHAKMSHA